MKRNRSVAMSMPSYTDYFELECACALSSELLSASAGIRFALMRVTYILFWFITIILVAGCTDTSYQDYPDHWPEIEQAETNGCLTIAGVYHAVSMTDEMACKAANNRNWKYSLSKAHESCFFLPDAMLSWDNNLPATESDTDQIIIGQAPDSITVYYVTQSKKTLRLSLQRDDDYSCDSNAIRLIAHDEDSVESGNSDPVHKSRSFYKGKDGSLIFEEHASHVRVLQLPPYLVNTLTRVWARWPLISETVSDDLMLIKAPLLEDAVQAAERGDMGAAYRLLEDYLALEDSELRAQLQRLFVDYPQLKPAALDTFSIQSLEATLSDHGDRAKAIEQTRLELYRTIATEQEYKQASENFEKVFPN